MCQKISLKGDGRNWLIGKTQAVEIHSKFPNTRDQMDRSEKEQRNFFHVGLVTGDE